MNDQSLDQKFLLMAKLNREIERRTIVVNQDELNAMKEKANFQDLSHSIRNSRRTQFTNVKQIEVNNKERWPKGEALQDFIKDASETTLPYNNNKINFPSHFNRVKRDSFYANNQKSSNKTKMNSPHNNKNNKLPRNQEKTNFSIQSKQSIPMKNNMASQQTIGQANTNFAMISPQNFLYDPIRFDNDHRDGGGKFSKNGHLLHKNENNPIILQENTDHISSLTQNGKCNHEQSLRSKSKIYPTNKNRRKRNLKKTPHLSEENGIEKTTNVFIPSSTAIKSIPSSNNFAHNRLLRQANLSTLTTSSTNSISTSTKSENCKKSSIDHSHKQHTNQSASTIFNSPAYEFLDAIILDNHNVDERKIDHDHRNITLENYVMKELALEDPIDNWIDYRQFLDKNLCCDTNIKTNNANVNHKANLEFRRQKTCIVPPSPYGPTFNQFKQIINTRSSQHATKKQFHQQRSLSLENVQNLSELSPNNIPVKTSFQHVKVVDNSFLLKDKNMGFSGTTFLNQTSSSHHTDTDPKQWINYDHNINEIDDLSPEIEVLLQHVEGLYCGQSPLRIKKHGKDMRRFVETNNGTVANKTTQNCTTNAATSLIIEGESSSYTSTSSTANSDEKPDRLSWDPRADINIDLLM